jgi:hypothetical protein
VRGLIKLRGKTNDKRQKAFKQAPHPAEVGHLLPAYGEKEKSRALRRQSGTHLIGYGFEGYHIVHSHIRKGLTVDLDFSNAKAMDEL